jgi:Kef-type K+ transport system membrane component KefB
MALSESSEGTDMPHQAEAVTEFMLPYFLTNIGMQLKLGALLNRSTIVLALIVTVLAVLSKLIGCGVAAWPLGKKKAAQIGMGMVPRGEVGVVVAQIGLSLNAVDASAYGVVLFMAVATTLIAPPFLVRLFKDETRSAQEPEFPVTQIS